VSYPALLRPNSVLITDLRRWQRWEARDLISHVVYIEQGEVEVDTLALEVRSCFCTCHKMSPDFRCSQSLGVACIPLSMPGLRYDEDGAREALQIILDDRNFV
jgi:hypothetical protein